MGQTIAGILFTASVGTFAVGIALSGLAAVVGALRGGRRAAAVDDAGHMAGVVKAHLT